MEQRDLRVGINMTLPRINETSRLNYYVDHVFVELVPLVSRCRPFDRPPHVRFPVMPVNDRQLQQ
jgi:hypothetical protein